MVEIVVRCILAVVVITPIFVAFAQAIEVMAGDRTVEWRGRTTGWKGNVVYILLTPFIFLLLVGQILRLMIKRRQLIVV